MGREREKLAYAKGKNILSSGQAGIQLLTVKTMHFIRSHSTGKHTENSEPIHQTGSQLTTELTLPTHIQLTPNQYF